MKIFNNLNRKENFKKNIQVIKNLINQRILDQKEILKDQNKTIKNFITKTELTEENEYEFYKELCNLMENRENMINKIESWINSLYQIEEFEGVKKCK